MRYTFSSGFAEHIKALIESKRAYGYDYSESERLLHNFDEFCVGKYPNAATITQEIFLKWAERRETENNKYRLNRISPVRELSRYMRSIGIDSYVLPNNQGGMNMKIKDEEFYKIIDSFLNTYLIKQKNFSPKTKNSYKKSLNLLLEFFKDEKGMKNYQIGFDDLTYENIAAFSNWLSDKRGSAPQTVNNRLMAMYHTNIKREISKGTVCKSV